MATPVHHLSLTEVADRIRSRQISSVEVTEACLKQIDRLQPQLNCFISLEAEAALAAAIQADEDLAQGRIKGPLHGVPLAHKDMYYRAGQVTTCGSKICQDFVPDHTATVIQRLEAAGALHLGGLNMAEFAAGPTGHNEHWGDCHNPWSPDHIAGGSSSGSGSAVAARLVYGALGSDTGGSVRLPAAFCGVVGIKPTWSRVSRYGLMPRSQTLDCAGPLTRTVRDCARFLQVIAGLDPMDPTSSPFPVSDYEAQLQDPIQGLKIGIPQNYYYDKLVPEIQAALEASLEVMRALGAQIIPVQIPHHPAVMDLARTIATAEATTIHNNWMRTRPEDYGRQIYTRTEPGFLIPATTYLEAMNLRSPITREVVTAVFSQVDILHLPLLSIPVPTLEETRAAGSAQVAEMLATITHCTRPINYLGLPALVQPCGFSHNGLPIGQQWVGRPFSEGRLFQVAHAYESATEWHRQIPDLGRAEVAVP